jgi:hypothetical protein
VRSRLTQPTLLEAASDPLAPWTISEAEYPFSGEPWEKLGFCLNYAVLAPSNHNTQPWRFKLGVDELKLYADRTRALPTIDPSDRELLISCGAALFHLRLAIRYFGHNDEVYLFPLVTERDLLAVVQFGNPRGLKANEPALFHAIVRRRTNRHAYDRRPVPEEIWGGMRQAAEEEDARLMLVSGDQSRRQLAQLVTEGDRVQMGSPSVRRELGAWIHPAHSGTRDGLPGYACGLNELLDFATPAYSFALRTFDLGKGAAAHDLKLVEGSPLLAILVTETDTPAAWLGAGQALARVLLTACAHGVSASFLNQPIEVEPLRAALRERLGLPGFPQILLRMGYGPEIKPTPRRSVRDVLL